MDTFETPSVLVIDINGNYKLVPENTEIMNDILDKENNECGAV